MRRPTTALEHIQFSGTGGTREKRLSPEAEKRGWRNRLVGVLKEVEAHTGPAGRDIIERHARGEISINDVEQELDALPDFREFQDNAWEFLEKIGVVKTHGANRVVDLEKIKTMSRSSLEKPAYAGRYDIDDRYDVVRDWQQLVDKFSQYIGTNDSLAFLFNAFHGKPVVSKTDWTESIDSAKHRQPEAKPLFYEPESAEAAFDIDAIRESRFHLGSWELVNRMMKSHPGDATYSPFHRDLAYADTAMACIIYHPNHGDGQRDSLGRLNVRYTKEKSRKIIKGDDPEYRPISSDWLLLNARIGLPKKYYGSPRQFLLDGNMMEMQKHNLLRADDFRETTQSATAELFGESVTITGAGYAMIGPCRYFLGRVYSRAPYRVYKVSEEKAIIATDTPGKEPQIVATFDLVTPKDLENSIAGKRDDIGYVQIGKSGYFSIPKSAITIEPYDEAKQRLFTILNPNAQESAHFSGADFARFDKAKKEVVRQTGVSLEYLHPRERTAFLRYYERATKQDKKRIYDFVRQYGDDGMRTFLSLDSESNAGEEMLELVETQSIEKGELARVFHDHSETIAFAESLVQSLLPAVRKVLPGAWDSDAFYSKIIARSQEFLHFAYEKIREDGATTYDDILESVRASQRGLSPEDCMQAVVSNAVIELVNQTGETKARTIIDDTFAQTANQRVHKHLELARSFITPPIANAEAVRDLGNFYSNKIRFESYQLNADMQREELEFLAGRMDETDKILDLGCGTGRHLSPLRQAGLQIDGLDYAERHVTMVKKENPDATVAQGDWKHTPFKDQSYDVVYSLGRNILHENQLTGQQALFAEVNRLLPVGGAFIFDIPDRDTGGYNQMAEKYKSVMDNRGIKNYRFGTVYDSPDGKHFMTRYVYSLDDIRSLAEENGFAVEEIERKELKNGHGDYNIYITLRKVEQALSGETAAVAMQAA